MNGSSCLKDVKSFINDCKTYENCILALKDNPFYNSNGF